MKYQDNTGEYQDSMINLRKEWKKITENYNIDAFIKLTSLSFKEKLLKYHKIILPNFINDNNSITDTLIFQKKLNIKPVASLFMSADGKMINNNIILTSYVTKESWEDIKEFCKLLKNKYILLGKQNYYEDGIRALDFINSVIFVRKLSKKEILLVDDTYDYLLNLEKKSTCAAKQVGCILLQNDKRKEKLYLKSEGYNHNFDENALQCKDLFIKKNNEWFYRTSVKEEWIKDLSGTRHKKWSLKNEIHAEIDCFKNNKMKIKKGDTLMITYSPCENCMNSISTTPVSNIIYFKDYDDIDLVKIMARYYNKFLYKIDLEYKNESN